MSAQQLSSKVTVSRLQAMKQAGNKIACITAYDASFAELVNDCGIDVVLVGDSLGMVIQGIDDTVSVTIDDMVYHTRAVARGNTHALLMVDMPFMSYCTCEQALDNAKILMQKGGAHILKVEVGVGHIDIVSMLVAHGVPVCAHLGLRPQAVRQLGGYKVQGRDSGAADAMLAEALAFEQAGASCLLLECVPAPLAKRITAAVTIPVIGIGAGVDCDGQILVLYDILNISKNKRPKFSKDYLSNSDTMSDAITTYVQEVRTQVFPSSEHIFE